MDAVANGLHADGRVVKPFGTTRNRTSSAASGDWAGTARNTPAENREFFQNPPPPDGPRRPPAALRHSLAAGADAPGNGSLVGGGTLSPARSPDTDRPHATATNAARLAGRTRYSTVSEDEGEKTTSRIPSTDRSAYGSDRGLAVAAKNHHAEPRPRELLLPKVKSRGGDLDSAPGRPSLLTPTATLLIQLNHPVPFSPPILPESPPPAPSRRDPPARAPALWPRKTGPQLSRC
jgi:hypothetical protein